MSLTSEGPYLAMAVICEKILQEKDGVLSAIRIIDRIVHTRLGSQAAEDVQPPIFPLFALLSFKSGKVGGKYNIKLIPQTPSGETMGEFRGPIAMEENGQGANVVITVNLQAKEPGLYWFDIKLDDELITRIPLHIEFQFMQTHTETPH